MKWLLVLAVAAVPISVSAQAWTRPVGHAYLKITRGHAVATERFEVDGSVVPFDASDVDASFRDESYYLYGEYGATNRLTIVGQIPYKRLSLGQSGSSSSANRVASVQIGVRLGLEEILQFADDRHRTSLSAILSLPTGYVRNAAPSVGAGQTDVDLVAAYGLSMYPVPAYAQVAGGLRYRSNAFGLSRTIECPNPGSGCVDSEEPDFGSEWLLRGEIGVTLGARVLLQGIAYGAWSNAPPETEFNTSNPIATRQRYSKVGGGVAYYPLPYVGLSLQVFETVAGKNTVDTLDWFFGIEYITDRR